MIDRCLASLLLVLTLFSVAGSAWGQVELPGKIDLQEAELQATQTIGMRVFAGGDEIGVVSDVSWEAGARIDKIRVRTSSPLGFGERIVEIPAPAFTVLRDAVVLDLTADEVDQFPPAPSRQ